MLKCPSQPRGSKEGKHFSARVTFNTCGCHGEVHLYRDSFSVLAGESIILQRFTPILPGLWHVIYYHSDKKYPCLGGLGLNKRFKLRIDCMVFNNSFSSFSYSPNSFFKLPSINITVLGIYRRILQKNSITVKRFF